MREIEFRGKSRMEGTEGRWLHSFGIKYGDDVELLYCDEETSDTWYYVDKETIGQYTGLKDKHGKKIFEGDIVKALYFGKEVIGKIEFIYGTFALTDSAISDNQLFIFEKLEVIGNIYDNPELLKEE